MISKERGMVLLTVLLFLLMITMLVLAALNTSLLETKMSSNFFANKQYFYVAESKLRQSERELLNDQHPEGAELIQHIECVDFYRVIVSDKSRQKAILQSTVAKITPKCTPKPKVKEGRQSFIYNYE